MASSSLSPSPQSSTIAHHDSTTRIQQINAKYHKQHTAALTHIKPHKPQRPPTPSAPLKDFILFPSRKSQRNHSPPSTKPHSPPRQSQSDKPSHLTTTTSGAKPLTEPPIRAKPRTRTPRHGGFRIVDLSAEYHHNSNNENDDSDIKNDRKWDRKPPPAPRPPVLDSPDFSDDDDDDDDDDDSDDVMSFESRGR